MDYGASQFAGGFVHSPIGDNAYGNNGATQKGNRNVPQTMRNVTIHQILKEVTGDDVYRVDGIDLSTFYIVGRVVDRSENNTTLKLKVDDGTGVIEVIHYAEETNPLIQMATQEWTVNTYVRVCGHMRSMEGKQSVVAFRIKVVTDFNEVTYHNLQCIFQHLHLTKGAAAPPASGPPVVMPGGGGTTYVQGGGHQVQAVQGNRIHVDVLAIYNEFSTIEAGLSLTYVLDTLRARGMNYTMPQLQSAVDYLNNEAQLFTTHDDQHHRTTAI